MVFVVLPKVPNTRALAFSLHRIHPRYLAKLPDDGQEVRYEMELVQVVGIRDLFGAYSFVGL